MAFAGLCTNVNCPYRHVNVNPKAVVCEGFLKGYCADGDEVCAVGSKVLINFFIIWEYFFHSFFFF